MANTSTDYKCCECGKTLPQIKFFRSSSDIFAGIGHLPICKDCLEREYKRFRIEYKDAYKAMQRLCMMFDIYYDAALFESCLKTDDRTIGNYLKKTNLGQYKNRTFSTSIEEGFLFFDASNGYSQTKSQDGKINPKIIEKWGEGLSDIDYDELEKHYKHLKSANPNCDSNQEIFIDELCYTKMQQMKAVREGRVDDYKKLADSYRSSFAQAGLKTVKDTSTTETFTIGVNAETIEKYTPVEYYKNRSLYKDFDNIQDYIERFLLRPLKNLKFGSTDRDHEFYVKDEGDNLVEEDDV